MPISLHHLTISDVQPSQLVDIAADTGYDHICLFVKVPYDPGPFWRVNSVAEAAELKHRLSDRNVSVYNTDTFMVTPDADLAGYHETLDIAAALGAKTINSLVTHHDRQACAEKLRTFADLAAQYGLAVVLEWYRFSHCRSMKEAVELLGLAGGNNLGINVDILHLIRNGETPADMIHVDPAIMFYAQLCDGPLRKPEQEQEDEAAANRLVAGQGEFPLVDFVRALPQDAVYSIEAPMSRLHRQLSASNMAKLHIESVRRILSAAGRT